jgi:hypothetical protein
VEIGELRKKIKVYFNMIYASMCVGPSWVSSYKESINKFSEKNELHLLTDSDDIFKNCIIYKYDKKEFSYYDKLIFIFDLLQKYKTRITYIDSDWLSKYNTNIEFDNISLYSYKIFDLNQENDVTDFFMDTEYKVRDEILSYIDCKERLDYYIPEALISIPYSNNIYDMYDDIKTLKKYVESYYNQENTNPRFVRYKKYGIGFAEGWGLSAVAHKFKYNLKGTDWRKKSII